MALPTFRGGSGAGRGDNAHATGNWNTHYEAPSFKGDTAESRFEVFSKNDGSANVHHYYNGNMIGEHKLGANDWNFNSENNTLSGKGFGDRNIRFSVDKGATFG